MRKLGHAKLRNHLAGVGKLLQVKTVGLLMNQKRIDLRQQPLSQKERMLTLRLKYQGTLFPETSVFYYFLKCHFSKKKLKTFRF